MCYQYIVKNGILPYPDYPDAHKTEKKLNQALYNYDQISAHLNFFANYWSNCP